MERADSLIVGGGIGGAVLALALGSKGKRVILLERESNPAGIHRPEVLAGLTLEVFDRLGVGERIRREAALPLAGFRLERIGGEPLLEIERWDLENSGAQPHSTDPARTRALLMEAALATGHVQLRRGVEVKGLLMDGDKAVGVQSEQSQRSQVWHASLMVGDDGVHSSIRTAMGVPLSIREFPVEFWAAVGPFLPYQPRDRAVACIDPDGFSKGLVGAVFLPLPENRSTFVFLIPPGADARFQNCPDDFYAAAGRLSPFCAGLRDLYPFPRSFSRFRRPFGHAERYVADGVALIGDAAHPMTPAGGQGANASVADAMALADVALPGFDRGDLSGSRLRDYEQLRRPANQRSLQISVRANGVLRFLQTCPWLAAPLLLSTLRQVNRSPETKQRFLRFISKTFAA